MSPSIKKRSGNSEENRIPKYSEDKTRMAQVGKKKMTGSIKMTGIDFN